MAKRIITDEMQAKMVSLYRDELKTAPEVGAVLGVSSGTVYRYLARNGIVPSKTEGAMRNGNRGKVYKNPPEVEKQIVAEYAAGASMKALGAKYGYASTGISRVVKRYGQPTRSRGATFAHVDGELGELLIAEYKEGASASVIAQQYGITYTNVCRHLRANGIEIRNRRPRGDNHPNWKGGRSITAFGYVLVRLQENSPFWGMALATGAVFEHRLIMAQYLGRSLCTWETVHHMDGNRQNNDISNLALHIGKHGKGWRYRCEDCGSYRLEPVDV